MDKSHAGAFMEELPWVNNQNSLEDALGDPWRTVNEFPLASTK